MKKPSTLAEQIHQAQREVSSWPADIRASVRLQGMSSLSPRPIAQQRAAQSQKPGAEKK